MAQTESSTVSFRPPDARRAIVQGTQALTLNVRSNNAYGFYLEDPSSVNAYAYIADSVIAENHAGKIFAGSAGCHVYSMGNNLSLSPFAETIAPH